MKIRRVMGRILVGFLLSAALGQRSSAEAQESPAAVAARQWHQTNEWQILAEYLQFLRIPNVSRDKPNIRRNAEHLVQMMEKRGLKPHLLEAPDASPLVYGELLSPGATATYVFYAHYDGQPVDPKEWATPPFEPFKKRMGWRFKWLSSFKTDFNFDFNVSFTPEQVKSGVLPYNYGKYKMKIDEKQGVSAFYRDKNGDIYHTYSSYERGIDLMNTTYNFLDLTAKGRDEKPSTPQDWVRYHDKYKSFARDA